MLRPGAPGGDPLALGHAWACCPCQRVSRGNSWVSVPGGVVSRGLFFTGRAGTASPLEPMAFWGRKVGVWRGKKPLVCGDTSSGVLGPAPACWRPLTSAPLLGTAPGGGAGLSSGWGNGKAHFRRRGGLHSPQRGRGESGPGSGPLRFPFGSHSPASTPGNGTEWKQQLRKGKEGNLLGSQTQLRDRLSPRRGPGVGGTSNRSRLVRGSRAEKGQPQNVPQQGTL